MLAKRMNKDALCAVTTSNSTAFHVLASRGYGIVLESLLKAVSETDEDPDDPRTLSREELLEICREVNASECTVLDCAYLSAKALAPMLECWRMRRNPKPPCNGLCPGAELEQHVPAPRGRRRASGH